MAHSNALNPKTDANMFYFTLVLSFNQMSDLQVPFTVYFMVCCYTDSVRICQRISPIPHCPSQCLQSPHALTSSASVFLPGWRSWGRPWWRCSSWIKTWAACVPGWLTLRPSCPDPSCTTPVMTRRFRGNSTSSRQVGPHTRNIRTLRCTSTSPDTNKHTCTFL